MHVFVIIYRQGKFPLYQHLCWGKGANIEYGVSSEKILIDPVRQQEFWEAWWASVFLTLNRRLLNQGTSGPIWWFRDPKAEPYSKSWFPFVVTMSTLMLLSASMPKLLPRWIVFWVRVLARVGSNNLALYFFFLLSAVYLIIWNSHP